MSWTIMDLGYDCAVDHAVYIHHFRGKSLKDNSLNRIELLKRSNKLLYKKWSPHIDEHIKQQLDIGNDVISRIRSGANDTYWLLHELD